MLAQKAEAQVRIEAQPVQDLLRHAAQLLQFRWREDFGGFQPCDFRSQIVLAVDGLSGQLAAAQIEDGQTVASWCAPAHGGQPQKRAVAGVFEQRLLGDGARRHDALHAALHRALGRRGVADLLADGD